MDLDTLQLALASLAVAVGAMIQGSIGFGLNVVAAPILVLIDTHFVPGPALAAAFVLTILVALPDRAGMTGPGSGGCSSDGYRPPSPPPSPWPRFRRKGSP